MKKKNLAVGGLAVTALVAAMSLTACSAENGVDGKDGVAGIDGKDGVSCSAKALEDASGYTLTCGDKEIGKILNGNDGIEGKAGASCSAAPNADTTGYVISCDGKEVGLIKNGVDGKDGASCSATPLDDETGFTLTCGEDEIGVIKNGTAGTSCSAAPNADATGYVLTCGGVEVGTILNGKDGDDGTSCSAVENVTKTGYTLSCNDENVGTILHGTNGDDCVAEALKDGSGVMITCGEGEGVKLTNGKSVTCEATDYSGADGTGYTITCGDEAPFTILNGAKGDKGEKGENAKTIYTMAMMNGGRVTHEYIVDPTTKKLVVGTVAEADKGVGNFVTWDGAKAAASGDYQIKTGKGKPEYEPGWWFSYGEGDGGKSSVTWPVDVGNPFSDDAKDPVIDICGGLCGTYVLDQGDWDYEPLVGVGFNVAGETKVGTKGVLQSADVTDWKGICVALAASGTEGVHAYVELSPQGEKTLTEYDNPLFKFSAKSSAIINMPWTAFEAEGWSGNGATAEDVVKILTQIKFVFRGETGEAGYFNIQKIGMYGRCGDVVNPYEGIPQYEFVAGTNIIKPFTASSDDKSSEFKTWRGVDGQSKFPNGEGWMFFYTDKNEDDPEIAAANKSDFIFPVSYEADHNFVKSHVEACDGICGTLQLKASETGVSHGRYAGLYTNVREDTDKGSDLSGIKGLCLTYTLKGDVDHVHLRIDPVDEKNTTGYNYHRKALPQAETPITLNVPWSEFKQDSTKDGDGNIWGVEKSIDYVVKQSASIQVFFGGDAGQTADFNIMQLGAYGNCQ
ncbi:hypothetical protein SAMN05720764_11311 [Fibrobacter sp. UWH5]|uniref:hypothetical protein n=1 Tax=Fibrobacter sp. UWH5 TaxID=1896211 RepID=UPI00091E3EA1|nr:hypothetical protein [Fibrobacter sp. UWH5]SHL39042.1 hypothetical protein SAMN05720764_11311 [Fibrobacter sp. UWH5]